MTANRLKPVIFAGIIIAAMLGCVAYTAVWGDRTREDAVPEHLKVVQPH